VLTVLLANLEDVAAFCDFLHKVRVEVVDTDGMTVRAQLPNAPSPLHERRELAGYVVTWNALNPGRQAELAAT
jgi:hypothetical protein